MQDRTNVGELVAKLFDRLDEEYDGNAKILDAVLLVDIDIPGDDGTVVMVESTTDRVVVQAGIIKFSEELIFTREDED